MARRLDIVFIKYPSGLLTSSYVLTVMHRIDGHRTSWWSASAVAVVGGRISDAASSTPRTTIALNGQTNIAKQLLIKTVRHIYLQTLNTQRIFGNAGKDLNSWRETKIRRSERFQDSRQQTG